MEKYSSHGNVYLVANSSEQSVNNEQVIDLCEHHSADGLLWGPKKICDNTFSLDIYNADGSKAEISGNGMTIFATYLKNNKYIANNTTSFLLNTDFCSVKCELLNNASLKLILGESKILFNGLFNVPKKFQNELNLPPKLEFYAVNVKNPHCVVILNNISKKIATTIGPLLENDPRFVNKSNVQFVKIINQNHCCAEIWERGSGYTASSGSSSCAIASVISLIHKIPINYLYVSTTGGSIQVNIQNNICSIINNFAQKLN